MPWATSLRRVRSLNPVIRDAWRTLTESCGIVVEGTVRNIAATPDGRLFLACSGVNKVAVVYPAP